MNIDWTTALLGAAGGYLVKGKVEDTKTGFKKLSLGCLDAIKESLDSNKQVNTAWNSGWSQFTNTNNGGKKDGV